MTQRQKNLELK